jgi:hypothetical protein
MVELVEVEPGKWRIKRPELRPQRSDTLPLPYVISDTMDPVEQVDGKFYTSKRAFRAVGKANGLIEVGNEKQVNKVRHASASREAEDGRQLAIKKAMEQVRSR